MIRARGVRKLFQTKEGQKVEALGGVDVQVSEGEVFVLLGPSGSGKTTLLRCVAGLEVPDEGEITLGDRVVFSSARKQVVPPEHRSIGMVFQSYAIWPHMTVQQNVELPLTKGKRRLPREVVRERVRNALALVGMESMASRPAPLLSGGQQQRVALARALAVEPEVLLMDEPLSNLDARLRQEVRTQIRELVKKIGVTVFYVTHDQEEAMDLADRIAVMHLGHIIQTGSAEDLYLHPAEPVVAQFFGQMNWVEGRIEAPGTVRTSVGVLVAAGHQSLVPGSTVRVGIRPEDIELTALASQSAATSENVFPCQVRSQSFLGQRRVYRVQAGADTFIVSRSSGDRLEGEALMRIPGERVHCFPQGAPAPTVEADRLPEPLGSGA